MADFFRKRAALAVAAALILAAGVSGATVIAMHHYRGMHSLFEADPPSPLLASPQSVGIVGLRSVTFTSPDGIRLSAWYAPPTAAERAAVIVTHGTNSDRASMLAELRMLAAAGLGVLAFDWPGLGASGGEIRWGPQAQRALSAAIEWLSAQPEIDPARIGGLGFSIGGFVMTQVAAQDVRLRAVVLEAPPPDFEDYLRVHCSKWGILSGWPGRWAFRGSGLLDSPNPPEKLIDRIAPRPVLLLAGTRDTEIPPVLVRKLYDLAREPKALWVVPGAQHGDYSQVAPAEYARRICEFFARNLGSAGLGSASLGPASVEFPNAGSASAPAGSPAVPSGSGHVDTGSGGGASR